MSTLIVCYSWGGHTRKIAERIAEKIDAPIFDLHEAQPYPAEYKPLADEAWKEIQAGVLRPIEAMPDLTGVTRLLIGSPNWCGTMAPPVATFLSAAKLSGVEAIPFCTHGGGGPAKVEPKMQAICPDAVWKPMLVSKGNEVSDEDLLAWMEAVGLC
ncbi:MAG: flavodoxin [Clostridia bacterium]|nr:flavodoxin [Clostridia bacterium]